MGVSPHSSPVLEKHLHFSEGFLQVSPFPPDAIQLSLQGLFIHQLDLEFILGVLVLNAHLANPLLQVLLRYSIVHEFCLLHQLSLLQVPNAFLLFLI